MKSLFKDPNSVQNNSYQPLADKTRPSSIAEIFGQDHLFTDNSVIRNMLNSEQLQNIILWGPAGSGKTTLAKIIANHFKCHTELLSAVVTNTAEIKQVFINAKNKKKIDGINTILIIDEIHHFNRSQQDIFLPYLEDGTITLIGATTENPSFELNSALLSRSMVLVLKALDQQALDKIVKRVEQIYQKKLPLNQRDLIKLYEIVAGDGRYLLGICERLLNLEVDFQDPNFDEVSAKILKDIVPRSANYDKSGDAHYNLISALHKSIRGSDVDASLYWLSRMLEAGENPHYLLRRLVRIASEDIGLADPNAIIQTIAAKDAYDFLGSPEGDLAIIQAVVYLATSPKSNSIYLASKSAKLDAKKYHSLTPPENILNASTKLMKDQNYGKGYIYDHDTIEGFSGQNYLPESMKDSKYYKPGPRGYEKEISKRIDYWLRLKKLKTAATTK
jgi:putative ATPase